MTTTSKQNRKTRADARIPSPADMEKKSRVKSVAEKKALIDSLCGSLAWVDYSVAEYLREKREEVKRENGK